MEQNRDVSCVLQATFCKIEEHEHHLLHGAIHRIGVRLSSMESSLPFFCNQYRVIGQAKDHSQPQDFGDRIFTRSPSLPLMILIGSVSGWPVARFCPKTARRSASVVRKGRGHCSPGPILHSFVNRGFPALTLYSATGKDGS